MKKISVIAIVALILLSLLVLWKNKEFFAGVKAHVPSGDQEEVAKGLTSVDIIPFELTDSNNLAILALINGRHSVTLMFHTAIDSLTLTTEALKGMESVKMNASVDVQSWGGSAKGEMSEGNLLQIGGLQWNDLSIFSDELSGPGTDGKFGPNLFEGKILEIHFDQRELRIYSDLPSFITSKGSSYRKMEYREKQGSLFVTGRLEIDSQGYANEFMVHSGFGGTALLDEEFVAAHDIGSRFETLSQRELKDSFGNSIKTRTIRIPSIEFAGIQFRDVPVEIFEGKLGRQKLSVLGGDLLKRMNLVIDPNDHVIYVTPSKLAEVPYRG